MEQSELGPKRSGKQEATLKVETQAPRPPISPPSEPSLSPPLCKSSHIPPGNRKPQLQPRLQTAPPSGAGGVGGEARGHRAKVSFVPARGGEGPGEDRGGQGRALDNYTACV